MEFFMNFFLFAILLAILSGQTLQARIKIHITNLMDRHHREKNELIKEEIEKMDSKLLTQLDCIGVFSSTFPGWAIAIIKYNETKIIECEEDAHITLKCIFSKPEDHGTIQLTPGMESFGTLCIHDFIDSSFIHYDKDYSPYLKIMVFDRTNPHEAFIILNQTPRTFPGIAAFPKPSAKKPRQQSTVPILPKI